MRRLAYGGLLVVVVGVIAWVYLEFQRLEVPSREESRATGSGWPLGVAVDLGGLLDLTGEPIDAANFENKLVVLDFWATWCQPCVAGMPAVAEARRLLSADPAIRVLAVNVGQGDSRERAAAFVADKQWSLPLAFDESGELSDGITGGILPNTGIIDENGNLCARLEDSPVTRQTYLRALYGAIAHCRAGSASRVG